MYSKSLFNGSAKLQYLSLIYSLKNYHHLMHNAFSIYNSLYILVQVIIKTMT